MMDLRGLFDALQANREFLSTFAQSLRQSPGVLNTHSDMIFTQYRSGASIEVYVEAELDNGCAVTWWLDIKRNGNGLEFDASILGTDDQGQFTFQELPTHLVSDLKVAYQVFSNNLMEAKLLAWYVENWGKQYRKYQASIARSEPQSVSSATVIYSREAEQDWSASRQTGNTTRDALQRHLGLRAYNSATGSTRESCYALT